MLISRSAQGPTQGPLLPNWKQALLNTTLSSLRKSGYSHQFLLQKGFSLLTSHSNSTFLTSKDLLKSLGPTVSRPTPWAPALIRIYRKGAQTKELHLSAQSLREHSV